jgi:hypothetical protein
MQNYSLQAAPRKLGVPAVALLLVAGVAVAAYFVVKHITRKPPPPPPVMPVAVQPLPPKPLVIPDASRKAFVISWPGYKVKGRGIANGAHPDGDALLVLVHDWPRTIDDLKSKAELDVYADSDAKGQTPIGHSDTDGKVALGVVTPGTQYFLHYKRKDGSFERRMASFKLVEPGANHPAKPHHRH